MIYIPELMACFALVVSAAFFAAAETALFSLSTIERKRIQSRHLFLSRYVDFLLDHPRRTLIAILIGNNLVHILASAIASVLAIRILGDQGVAFVIAAFTMFLVFFGEILPKTFAVRSNEWTGVLTALPLHYFAKAVMPLRQMVRAVTDSALALLVREARGETDKMSDKQFRALIQIGQEEGVLEDAEARRLARLFQFEERSIREIMTPRTELIAFDIQEPREAFQRLLETYHYSYMPVYRETLDHILGVISTQEIMLHPEKSVEELLKPPYYVPETKRIDDLLFEMKQSGMRFALCVDEYGGTAGLVTLEDILEEIFGEIYDEYAKEETVLVKVGRDEFLVDGKISLAQFNEALRVHLASEVSETLAGYVMEKLGRIPKLKETIRTETLILEVRAIERQRIAKVFVKKAG
jgi:CBS domain containing-hemolysin-like protein